MTKSKVGPILEELVEGDFFSSWRTPSDVVRRLDQRGFRVEGKKKGMVCRMLTLMCQNSAAGLEREEIPKDKRTGNEKYRFRKTRRGING
jgi:hypothetical protein